MKKFFVLLGLIIALFVPTSAFASESSIECIAVVNQKKVTISGQIPNITESVPVTLRVGELDEIFYIGQELTSSDGKFSFSFSMPEIAPGGSIGYYIATNTGTISYNGNFTYVTEDKFVCIIKTSGQSVNIRGRVVNSDGCVPVTLRVGSIENVLYVGQTMSKEDGGFQFTFKMKNTVPSGSYEYLIATDTGIEPITGVLDYIAPRQVICTAEVSGRNVKISGTITNVTDCHQVEISVENADGSLYTGQTTSQADGSFSFSFELPEDLESGSYSFTIDTDAGTATYTGVLEYIKMVERQFFDGNILIGVSSYVPTISGNVSCIDGKTVTFNVVNSTDNTVIARDTVTPEDGIYNLNYTLPSLLTGKEYNVTISCEDDTKNLFSVDVKIDSSIVSVSVSGDIQVADNVKLETSVQTTNSDLINESTTITTNKSISTTIPNLVANMSCSAILRGYESVVVDNDPSPEPEPLPDADETFQAIETEYSVGGSVGGLDRVMVNISKIPMLHEKVFTINYDSTQLELIDTCAFTNATELTTGTVAGTYIEILSVTDGQVKFKINKVFSDKVVTSGVINMMTFKKLSAEAAVVTSKVEKDSNI